MTNDALVRALAVLAAVAILAAPYRGLVVAAVQAGVEHAKTHAATLGRVAAAGLLIAAAWGTVTVPVETPSAEMQSVVQPVAVELARMPMGDRLIWAATWNKAALVVAGDATAKEVAFTDTRSLRLFTALTLDIAWRRLAGQPPGNVALRKAVEASYGAAVGTEEVPVSRDIRDRYAAYAKAVAWAGLNGG